MINLNYLKTTTNNDKDTIRVLLEIFKEQAPELKSDILSAFEQKNWTALQKAAHKAKNSFQILGLNAEAEKLQELEVLCKKEKDTHLYKNYVDEFLQSCDEALNEIEKGIKI
ncbi:MAG: Hpt domain-containing protein [Bacteroidales bacterium]|nr:Hpt domain-containing protein [Bacteroidales bacterium]